MSDKPAATIFSNVTGLLFYGFWLFAAVGAEAFLSNPANRDLFPAVLSPSLFIMFLYWQLTPVITASMGASLNLKKLLVYPIPLGQLFLVEVLLRVATCVEMVLLLIGAIIGIARNPEIGGPASLPRLIATAAIFVGFNLLLSAGLRNFLERLLQRRRIRAVMTVLFIAFSILPQFLLRSTGSMDRLKQWMPASPLVPWKAAATIFLGQMLAQPFAVLIVYFVAAYLFGRWQFHASLRFDGESNTVRPRKAESRSSLLERAVRFPARFLPDPVAAIVEKETVSLSRMAPFRLIFFMGSALGILLWLPRVMGGRPPGHSFMNDNILSLATAYGVLVLGQVNYFNMFGFDRSAVQTWFSLPVSLDQVIRGKNIASAWFICLEILLTTLVTIACRIPVTPLKIVEGFAVSTITAVYLVSFGNITSTRMPRALNPEKMNQGGASKVLNLLILFCFPVVLSPIVIAFWARSVFSSELIFFLLLALAAVFGSIFYWVAASSASHAARNRRESILSDLSRSEGPVSIS